MISKISASIEAAFVGILDGATVLVGGLGQCRDVLCADRRHDRPGLTKPESTDKSALELSKQTENWPVCEWHIHHIGIVSAAYRMSKVAVFT
jgi:hypothetical protein